jgi:hypothetical protein
MRHSRIALGLLALTIGLVLVGMTAADAPRAAKEDWRQNYEAFRKLPATTQERIRSVDRELHEEDPLTRERLIRVMERYVEWLETLTPQERASLEQMTAPDAKARRVRELREGQWVKTLSEADRRRVDEARKIGPEERAKAIADIKERDRQIQLEWDLAVTEASQNQEKLQQEIARWQKEVRAVLLKKDLNEENKRLTEASKKGRPIQLIHLAELSEQHGIAVPPMLQRSPMVYPPVPRERIMEFLRTELTLPQREQYERRFQDSGQREQAYADLLKLYWQKHPAELKRIREEVKAGKPRPAPVKPKP